MEQGHITNVEGPGGMAANPFAINNRGQIAGVALEGVRYYGFLLSNGQFTRITPPGQFFYGAWATDIDDRGRIAGVSL
jgi:hypothetical protein